MEQMQQRGIIKPTDVLVAVKVETFDQEEGNRNAYYYPQHRATPVFAAMPQRLLDTSIKYVQDYRKAIQEWAIFMNFENYDKNIIYGKKSIVPRCTDVPIIIPLPKKKHYVSIYQLQKSK